MATSKKDPSEYTVEEKLKSLYQLQTILTKIDEIKTLRGELPLEVQDLEDEVIGLSTRIENNKADISALNKGIAENKNKIENCKAIIANKQEKIDNVSNNREFDSLNKEIEFQGLEIELAEKKIRDFSNGLNIKNEELLHNQELVKERQQELVLKKQELEEIIEETRIEEEKLRADAKELEVTIEPRLLLSFKRIRKNTRNGLGIVYVERDACGGCFNKIPPQRQLDIRMRKKIIVCEYCGRILIDPELAGVQKQEPAEAPAPKKRTRKAASENKE